MMTKKKYICPECEVMDEVDDICIPEVSRTDIDSGSGNGGTSTPGGSGPGLTDEEDDAGAKSNNFNIWDDDDY